MQQHQSQEVETARLWNEKEVATFLGVSVAFLQHDRVREKKIAYLKIGRAVRYDYADVVAYAQSCRLTSRAGT